MSFKILAALSAVLAAVFIARHASKDRSFVRMETVKDAADVPRRVDESPREAKKNSVSAEALSTTVNVLHSREDSHRAFLKRTTDAYPLQPLKDRVPWRTVRANAKLSGEADADLKEFETVAEGMFDRSWALKDVHDEAVKKFSDTEGQGVRRIPIFSKEMIDSLKRSDDVPLQPEIVGTTVAEPAATAERIEDALKTLHRAGIGDFASPQDFGYVTEDGKKAAGFIPHRFTKTPPTDPRLRLKRIDLVGLLLHPKPVVYVSDKLPRMEELTAAPTRSPDDYEAKAIESIRQGETLVVRDETTGLRMVGAIRAAKQCTACHDCQRGELLGAFSYRFE